MPLQTGLMVSFGVTPEIFNVDLTDADTEYSQVLPAYTKKFSVKERNGNAFRLAFAADLVATPNEPYLAILANQTYYEDLVFAQGLTIYFAAPVAARVIEIIAWT